MPEQHSRLWVALPVSPRAVVRTVHLGGDTLVIVARSRAILRSVLISANGQLRVAEPGRAYIVVWQHAGD